MPANSSRLGERERLGRLVTHLNVVVGTVIRFTKYESGEKEGESLERRRISIALQFERILQNRPPTEQETRERD